MVVEKRLASNSNECARTRSVKRERARKLRKARDRPHTQSGRDQIKVVAAETIRELDEIADARADAQAFPGDNSTTATKRHTIEFATEARGAMPSPASAPIHEQDVDLNRIEERVDAAAGGDHRRRVVGQSVRRAGLSSGWRSRTRSRCGSRSRGGT